MEVVEGAPYTPMVVAVMTAVAVAVAVLLSGDDCCGYCSNTLAEVVVAVIWWKWFTPLPSVYIVVNQ